MMHPQVPHPRALKLRQDLTAYNKGLRGKVAEVNDFLATHLAVVFGLAWTVWVFMIVTVGAYWMPNNVQSKIFFFSSGCIQLFALPLLTYIGNKAQKATDLQSDAFHQALTHIATVEDEVHELLIQNTELTRAVHSMLDKSGNTSLYFKGGCSAHAQGVGNLAESAYEACFAITAIRALGIFAMIPSCSVRRLTILRNPARSEEFCDYRTGL